MLFHCFDLGLECFTRICTALRQLIITNHSIDPHYFAEVSSCLDDIMLFTRLRRGTAIPVGAKLLEVRHLPIREKSDLSKVVLSSKRVWKRVSDPAQTKRKLSLSSVAFLTFWDRWCQLPALLRPLQFPQRATLVAAADALGSGLIFAVGGFVKLGTATIWFSEKFAVMDFAFASIELIARMLQTIFLAMSAWRRSLCYTVCRQSLLEVDLL